MTGLWVWCLSKHRLSRKCDMFLGEKARRARLSRPREDEVASRWRRSLGFARGRGLLYARCEPAILVRETIIEVEIKNVLSWTVPI